MDLRYADFTAPEVEIHTYSIMGGQTILVPPEVNVDLRGVGVMGTFDHIAGRGRARRTAGEDPWLLAVGQGRRQAQEAQGRLTPALRDLDYVLLQLARMDDLRGKRPRIALEIALAQRNGVADDIARSHVQDTLERTI